MSSSTTPTAASFSANDTSNINNNNNTSISTNNNTSNVSTNNSNTSNNNMHRPITPSASESSPCHSIRSNQAVSALSPASSIGSTGSHSSESVRFSPFPSPNQARLRRGGHGEEGEILPSEEHTDIASSQSQSQVQCTSPKPSSIPPVVSPATKISQFQLQPPKTEFKPSNSSSLLSSSFSSMPSLTASDSNASMASSQSQQWPDGQTPNVYINGLPAHFPEDQLYALTAMYGPVKSVRSFTRHVADRASGYGFVLFEEMEDAQRCIDNLKQYKHLHPSFSKQVHKIPGTPYFHMASNQQGQQAADAQNASAEESFKAKMGKLADAGSTNLYIEGLPLSIDDTSLANLIHPYPIKSSRMFQTKLSDPPRVIAFVRLETREAAEEIIERLHGRMCRGVNDVGSRISVRFADSSDQRDLRRVERTARTDDVSPNRLTIAQAALLNLHGQDATMKPRVRRHPAPVTSAPLHFPMPTSSSLPVIGTRRSDSHAPISQSVSLPGMGMLGLDALHGLPHSHSNLSHHSHSLSPHHQHTTLPVIGTRTPPIVGGNQQERPHNHGSTLPVHPQIDAFNNSMVAVRQEGMMAASRSQASQLSSSASNQSQLSAQDVLEIGGEQGRGRGYADQARGYAEASRGYGDQASRGYADQARGFPDQSRGFPDQTRGYADQTRGFADQTRGLADQARGFAPNDDAAWLTLNALKKQQLNELSGSGGGLSGNGNGGGGQPFWDEQIQALRRNGVPFVSGRDQGIDEEGIVLHGGAGAGGRSTVRAKNGYTPAEEAILRAHSQKMRAGQGQAGLSPQTQFGRGDGQAGFGRNDGQQFGSGNAHRGDGQQFGSGNAQFGRDSGNAQFNRDSGTSQFNPGQRSVVQSHGQTFRPARIVNPFAAEEQQFHEQHQPQAPSTHRDQHANQSQGQHGNQVQHETRISRAGTATLSLHANGQFSMTGQGAGSTTRPTAGSSLPSQQEKAPSTFQPHLRASTQPQRAAPGGPRHAPTNSLSVTISGGEGRTSAALPIVAPPAQIRQEGGGTGKNESSGSAVSAPGITATSSLPVCGSSSVTPTPSHPHPRVKTTLLSATPSSTLAVSAPPVARSASSPQSALASPTVVTSTQVQPSASQVQASASYDSPLNSPALTYSSSNASLSPATPYFGGFANPGETFQGGEPQGGNVKGNVDTDSTATQQKGRGEHGAPQVMQARERLPVDEDLVGEGRG